LITNNFAIDRKKENIGKTNKDIIKIYILLWNLSMLMLEAR
jgi:hypothetical protein